MWHHLLVTWEQESGRTMLYFDGRAQSAFWVGHDDCGTLAFCQLVLNTMAWQNIMAWQK